MIQRRCHNNLDSWENGAHSSHKTFRHCICLDTGDVLMHYTLVQGPLKACLCHNFSHYFRTMLSFSSTSTPSNFLVPRARLFLWRLCLDFYDCLSYCFTAADDQGYCASFCTDNIDATNSSPDTKDIHQFPGFAQYKNFLLAIYGMDDWILRRGVGLAKLDTSPGCHEGCNLKMEPVPHMRLRWYSWYTSWGKGLYQRKNKRYQTSIWTCNHPRHLPKKKKKTYTFFVGIPWQRHKCILPPSCCHFHKVNPKDSYFRFGSRELELHHLLYQIFALGTKGALWQWPSVFFLTGFGPKVRCIDLLYKHSIQLSSAL